jgi:hypothetical protein
VVNVNELLEKRQLNGALSGLLSPFLPNVTKAKVLKTLTPEYDPNATRAIYIYGPYKLPPSTVRATLVYVGTSETN